MTKRGAGPERRIGVYGGTFNPIHRGHLRSAREVAHALDLQRILFVPSAQPPHKRNDGDEYIAPAEQRLDWVERAIADEPLFEVDAIELGRDGPSYSVETMATLVERLAPARLVFIIGHDAFSLFGTWREPLQLLAMVDFAVTSRPPVMAGHLETWLPACAKELIDVAADGLSGRHRETGTRIELVEIPALDVSASQVRERIRHGETVSDLLPESVQAAVLESGCYGAAQMTRQFQKAGKEKAC
jgi:nicotinate-nucleotide adenylyltransferase